MKGDVNQNYMEIGVRPLPEAEEIIKSTGLKMTYAFDDLVFVEHNPFLIQFDDDNGKQLYVRFNVDCYESDRKSMLNALEIKAVQMGMRVIETSKFSMKQKEGTEEIELTFQ